MVAAACALLASCASDPVAPPAAIEYRPAQPSTLVTKRGSRFLVASWQHGAATTTILARQQVDSAPRPVARLLKVRDGPAVHMAVQRLPESWATADRADHEIAALEQLYSLVLRQEPHARFCLGSGSSPCDPVRDGVSHAQVLQALAGLRGRAVARAPAAVPWRVVEMHGATRSWDADVVGVRATDSEGPLENLPVYFNRAPHSICAARTGVDGLASCRLEDQHDDGHQHDHATLVVAAYPGDVRPDRVLLPTTYVLQTATGAAPPAFARPLPLPTRKP